MGGSLTAGILALFSSGAGVSQANSLAVRYVAPGANCGGASPCYGNLQTVIDSAADGDEIRVAAGSYSGAMPAIYSGNAYTQVVIITKSVTLRGGFTAANWAIANPPANQTIIDVQQNGRG